MQDGFPQRLRQLRQQKKLSQTELGNLVKIHYNHIGRYERGGCKPNADALNRLAEALDVSGDYLLNGAADEAAKAKFEDRELLRQFQEIEKLSVEDKVVVKIFLNAFLVKKQVEELATR